MLPAILESRLKILESLAQILDFRRERACLGRQAGVHVARRAENEPIWPIRISWNETVHVCMRCPLLFLSLGRVS